MKKFFSLSNFYLNAIISFTVIVREGMYTKYFQLRKKQYIKLAAVGCLTVKK